jgi:sec-independent protein translocase protein TatB
MFDIGWSEMAVVLLVALVVIGPRDLPRVARTMGRWVAKGRAMAREFQTALEDMAREAELDKVKSEIEKAGRTNLGKTIENTIDPTGELGKAFDPTAKSPSKTAKNAAATNAAADPPKAVEHQPEPRAAEVAPADPAPADPAPAQPAVAEPQPEAPATASRARAKKRERETVPADPS